MEQVKNKHVTLVLNQAYEPIKVVPWQKAVELIYLNKVDVLSEYPEVIRSQYYTWKVPAVIRMTKACHFFVQVIKFKREFVLARDDWKCQYCGKPFPTRSLTFDHVLPKSRGGPKSWENIVAACKDCNSKKDRHTPSEAKMRLVRPRRPRWLPGLLIKSLGPNLPDQWKEYVGWLEPKASS